MRIVCRISVDVELRVSRSRLKISSSTSQLTISCELLTFLFRHTVTDTSWDQADRASIRISYNPQIFKQV